MKKLIRLITILLSVTMSVNLLSGFVMKSSSNSTLPKAGNPKLPIVSKSFTLKIWAPTSADVTSTMKNLGESSYYKELEKRTGVHVEFIHPAIGQELNSLNIMLASGDYPDIIQLDSGGFPYPGGLDKGISDGVILKLNDLVTKYAPNYNALIHSAQDITKGSITDAGNIAAFFATIPKVNQPAWFGMVVRQDWLEDLKLKTPVTFNDWEIMLKAFKAKKGAVAPLMMNYTGFTNFDIFNAGYGVGARFYQVNSKIKFGPMEAGYKDYLTMMNRWYGEGLVDKDFSTKQDFVPSATFTTTGKAGAWNDVYVLLSIDKANSKDPKYKVVAVPAPVKKAGDALHLRQTNVRVGNSQWIVTTSCKDPITAVKWIDYNYSPDGAMLAAYGIKGKTYTLGKDGKPAFTSLITKNPKGLSFGQAVVQYVKPAVNGGGSEYHWERELTGQPKENLAAPGIWGTNNDGAYYVPPTTLTTDEGTEYAQIMGDINTYISEMNVKFIMGLEPLANYNDFVSKIKSMNIDRAIKLQQAALDRYNARK